MFKLVLDRFAYNAWKIQQAPYRFEDESLRKKDLLLGTLAKG